VYVSTLLGIVGWVVILHLEHIDNFVKMFFADCHIVSCLVSLSSMLFEVACLATLWSSLQTAHLALPS
jgi:hypothetical protein